MIHFFIIFTEEHLAKPLKTLENRDKKYLEKLGEKISARRKEQALTLEQLAEKIGTSHSDIIRIESGNVNSSINKLRRLAEALDIGLGELVEV